MLLTLRLPDWFIGYTLISMMLTLVYIITYRMLTKIEKMTDVSLWVIDIYKNGKQENITITGAIIRSIIGLITMPFLWLISFACWLSDLENNK